MRNRPVVAAAVLSFLGALGYAVWLRAEAVRAGWAEVSDPVD